jgi:oligopeptidase B
VSKPVAPQQDYVHESPFGKRPDPFFWMREKDSPQVLDNLRAENAYVDEQLSSTAELQQTLFEELRDRIPQNDESVPQIHKGWWYYSRIKDGQNYWVTYRKRDDEEEQVLLDPNAIEAPYVSIGSWDVNESDFLFFTLDLTGFRQYQMHVKDLNTGEELELPDNDVFSRVTGSCWHPQDHDTLFFVSEDEETKRANELWRYNIKTQELVRLHEEEDERFGLSASPTSDDKFMLVSSSSHVTTEYWLLEGDDLIPMLGRTQEVEYYVDHREGLWYVHTNEGAKNFKIEAYLRKGDAWEKSHVWLPEREGVYLEGVHLFKDYAVLEERENALAHFSVMPFGEEEATFERVSFPDEAYETWVGTNFEYDVDTLRIGYSSMRNPTIVYDLDLKTCTLKKLKQAHVGGGYDPNKYEARRTYATARDGTKIPISYVRKLGARQAPLYLVGYGSYGLHYETWFSHSDVSLLERGFTVAVAHIRGGSEYGEVWHDEGKLLRKRNSFTDFIDCADFLVSEGYTTRDQLVIQGGSAGGLLMGAVLNMRPDVCAGAILSVPFVDVLNTMSDPDLPLTVGEYEEWGNPADEHSYAYMSTYCPYTNIERKAYPHMYVVTSYNDSQVMYWEPQKYVAKMRTLRTDDNLLLFRCKMDSGHSGAAARYAKYREKAEEIAFILHVTEKDPQK